MKYFVKDHMFTIVITVVALALIAAGTIYVQTARSAEQDASEPPIEKLDVAVSSSAPGWNAESSTPPIMHVKGSGDDGDIDYYHAFAIGTEEALELSPGDYEIEFVTPVNEDGYFYEPPATARFGTESSDRGAVEVKAAYTGIEADKASDDQVSGVIADVTDAVSFGDATLTGASGEKILSTVKLYLAGAAASKPEKENGDGTLNWTTNGNVKAPEPQTADTAANPAAGGGEPGPSSPSSTPNPSGAAAKSQAASTERSSKDAVRKWIEAVYGQRARTKAVWIDDGDGSGHYEAREDGADEVIETAGHYE